MNENQNLEDFVLVDDEMEEEEPEFTPNQIIQAMQNLSPAYRMIFNLYVFENLTHREIAEQLKISEGTSKSNLAKAKKNMKKILKKREI